ncbi:hypothetical protein BAE44_0024756 [Dichanthelium oligosanthes]|uniref:Uncharacterized protein n=1 Tax=Dichanthelium oligosanthes TaxID=888268 RepID=A0A1E5UN62_9POAL|nr:hypothetical protein BAE44_0024756 [Dichanthelium oligosanthes]
MAAAKGKRVYLIWTDDMDDALLAVLVKHHNNGDHAQNGWKPHVYTAAIRNIRAKTGSEISQESHLQTDGESPDMPQKRHRTGDAILCMLGDMKSLFHNALKSTEPLSLPHVTPPFEILAALQVIPDLARCDLLQSYGKLSLMNAYSKHLWNSPWP